MLRGTFTADRLYAGNNQKGNPNKPHGEGDDADAQPLTIIICWCLGCDEYANGD